MSRRISPMDVRPPASLRFLYRTLPGRGVLRLMISPRISSLAGHYMNSPLSQRRILPFIRKAQIDMSEYKPAAYRSYNAFFTRHIRPEARPIDREPTHLIAPCDAHLSVYRLRHDRLLPVKGAPYTLTELLQNPALAKRFEDGICLIFRLAVDDYHRYCFPDSGRCDPPVHIPGVFHTVQPVATDRYPVYHRNTREYTVLHTDHFGEVIQMEVGALMVGRICNHRNILAFARGDEKGYFEFGGSTVILIFRKGAVTPDPEFFRNTAKRLETVVRQGEWIGTAPEGRYWKLASRELRVKNTAGRRQRGSAAAAAAAGRRRVAAAAVIIDQQKNDDDEQDPRTVIAVEQVSQTHIR